MNYPNLVSDKVCKTDITVKLYSNEISEDGEPSVVLEQELKCNWQSKSRRVLSAEKVEITIIGTAYFNGDIAPTLSEFAGGEVVIFGETRRIYQGTKARNPDGSVNYTMLEVM